MFKKLLQSGVLIFLLMYSAVAIFLYDAPASGWSNYFVFVLMGFFCLSCGDCNHCVESQFLKKFKIFLCCSRIDLLPCIHLDAWKHVPVCFPYVLFYLSDKSQFSIGKVIKSYN